MTSDPPPASGAIAISLDACGAVRRLCAAIEAAGFDVPSRLTRPLAAASESKGGSSGVDGLNIRSRRRFGNDGLYVNDVSGEIFERRRVASSV